MTLQTVILSTELSDFLEQIIILKSFDSVLFVATDKNKNKKKHIVQLWFLNCHFSQKVLKLQKKYLTKISVPLSFQTDLKLEWSTKEIE